VTAKTNVDGHQASGKTDWPLMTIAECASGEPYSTQIGPFGEKIRAQNYTVNGAPVLRGTNVNPEGRFHDDDFVFIDPALADREFNKFVCEADDVILCHKGTLGKIGIVPKRSRFKRYIMGNSMMKVRCDRSKLEPLYLYYWLCSRDGQHYLFSRVSQVGVPQIQRPLGTLREAMIPVPPLTEQKAIAAVLGSLDDKIELNRRMNATLEAMVRALFQSWFVDFDPVRAKLDGRQPTDLDPATTALFPNEFEDSELGPIPKGWRVGKLGEVAMNPRRTVSPKDIRPNTPYIALEHMPRRSIALDQWSGSAEVTSGKFEFRKREILFGKLRPYFHKVGIAPLDGVCSTDILVIAPSTPEWFGFVLGHASSDELVNFTNLASTGTKMPRTNWSDISCFAVVLPREDIAEAFTDFVVPIADLIISNAHTARRLAAARDALLPKLLSGEIKLQHTHS
jgi:type I restriction enzyme, S subunit